MPTTPTYAYGDFQIDPTWRIVKQANTANGYLNTYYNPANTAQSFTVGSNQNPNDLQKWLLQQNNNSQGIYTDPEQSGLYLKDNNVGSATYGMYAPKVNQPNPDLPRLQTNDAKFQTGEFSAGQVDAANNDPNARVLSPGLTAAQAAARPRVPTYSIKPPGSSSGTPATPSLSGPAADYQKYLVPGADEIQAQNDYNSILNSRDFGLEQVRNKHVGMQFIAGESDALARQAALKLQPLQQRLATAQAQRQAALEASKFALSRADQEAANAREESRYQTSQRQYAQETQRAQQEKALDLTLKYGIKTPAVNIGGTFYRSSDMVGWPTMASFLKEIGATSEADARNRGLLSDISTVQGATELTSDMKEYNLAKQQGFTGTFLNWQKTNANLKNSSTSTVNQTSTLLKEYQYAVSQGFKGTFLEYQQQLQNIKNPDSSSNPFQ